MNKVSFSDRLRYAFDNYMARGTIALLGGLFVVAMIMITLITAFVKLAGIAPEGVPTDFFSLWWMGMVRTLDTGTMGGDAGSLIFLLSMLAVTLGGVFTVSALIGVLNNGLEEKLDELRKGR